MNTRMGAALAAFLCAPAIAGAQDQDGPDLSASDEIVVLGRAVSTSSTRIEVEREILVDTATALRDIPGANVNSNGIVTGIAQYRGMFGDRVSVDIDQLGVTSGGPNAMDAPLSYMSPMITEELIVERGIASVSRTPESIGGYISTKLARGEFAADSLDVSGMLGTRYSENGNISTSAGRFTVADDAHRVSVVTGYDTGDDISTPQGDIIPSRLHRERYDVSYAFRGANAEVLVFAGNLDTTDTVTPALPMDIRFIETDLFGAQLSARATDSLTIETRFAYNDVAHLMDNFALRGAPMPMMYRQNLADGEGQQFYLAGRLELAASELLIGVDGIGADHNSLITNPNMAMFRINNFNDVERDVIGAFAEWSGEFRDSSVEIGLRYKAVETNAGFVGAAGMPEPMMSIVDRLADAFNAADRNRKWNSLDAVVKFRREMSDRSEWIVELGSKTRAPSYQELYLWLPMQATGGLADGRTYVGDLGLEEERSNEIVLGITARTDRLIISPQVYFRKVDNYIQGVPSDDMMVNMIATMMSGTPALQFANVDAEIWGADIAWKFDLSEHLFLDGIASYSRGRRTDVSDNLYRLAPANGSIGITYSAANWSVKPELVIYGDQDKVSSYNGEQDTSGYELVNVAFNWEPSDTVRLEARLDNLLDRSYQDHLAGVNRAMGSGIPVGTRLYGAGRTVSAGVVLTF